MSSTAPLANVPPLTKPIASAVAPPWTTPAWPKLVSLRAAVEQHISAQAQALSPSLEAALPTWPVELCLLAASYAVDALTVSTAVGPVATVPPVWDRRYSATVAAHLYGLAGGAAGWVDARTGEPTVFVLCHPDLESAVTPPDFQFAVQCVGLRTGHRLPFGAPLSQMRPFCLAVDAATNTLYAGANGAVLAARACDNPPTRNVNLAMELQYLVGGPERSGWRDGVVDAEVSVVCGLRLVPHGALAAATAVEGKAVVTPTTTSLVICDFSNDCVRVCDADSRTVKTRVTTVAGRGPPVAHNPAKGSGLERMSQARRTALPSPSDLAIDVCTAPLGSAWYIKTLNGALYRYDSAAGGTMKSLPLPVPVPAASAMIGLPCGLLVFTLPTQNQLILHDPTTGACEPLVGVTGAVGNSNGRWADASLHGCYESLLWTPPAASAAVDGPPSLLVLDTENCLVRRIPLPAAFMEPPATVASATKS